MKRFSLINAVMLSVSLLALGCQPSGPSSWQTAGGSLDADALIEKVREAYQQEVAYSDDGVLTLSYTLGGAPQEERHPFSVAYDGSDLHDMRLFHARLNTQRQRQSIAIFDPETNNVDQQILVRDGVEFKKALDLPEDPILQHFCSGFSDLPLANRKEHRAWMRPLPYVLASGGAEQPWFTGPRQLLDPSFIDGQSCQRIRIETAQGNVVVWVDAESYLVRRLELPETLLNDGMLKRAQVGPCRLVAEFSGAEWGAPQDRSRLSWSPGGETHQVRRFVSLPAPFPSELIGKPALPFEVQAMTGHRVESQTMKGSITAWLWTSSDPLCREPLVQFDTIARKYASDSKARFFNVATDLPSTLTSPALAKLLSQWRIQSATTVRDWKQVGRSNFDIEVLPTLLVLDQSGVVQYFKVIDDGQVAAPLNAVMERLSRGENIAREMRTEYDNYLKVYRQQLAEASWDSNDAAILTRPASFESQKLPTRYRMSKAWTCKELVAPGNLASGHTDSFESTPPSVGRIGVLEGFQSLCVLDRNGNVLSRTSLGNEANDSYTQLKCLPSGAGLEWGVSSILGTRVKYVDRTGQVSTVLNAEEGRVRDFVLANSQGDESPEVFVGFWDGAGVKRFTTEGRLIAELDRYPNIASLAVTPPSESGGSKLLGTSREGGLFRAEFTLQAAETTGLAGINIGHVYTAKTQRRDEALLCVLGVAEQGGVIARGLDEQWNVRWELKLTDEVFDQQVQFVQSGTLDDETLWAIARPNGTIHLVNGDGTWRDEFVVGNEIRGLTISSDSSGTQLVVSTPEGIVSWWIERWVEQARVEDTVETVEVE
jgi:hypothetical protein